MQKYSIEFTATVEIEAEDAYDAVEKANEIISMDDMYVYVDGEILN